MIINEIKEFSKIRQWKHGLKEEYIISNVKRKKRVRAMVIKELIQELFNDGIIYSRKKYGNIYWLLVNQRFNEKFSS